MSAVQQKKEEPKLRAVEAEKYVRRVVPSTLPHGPIDTLARIAALRRTSSVEGTYGSVYQADFINRVLSNMAPLRLDALGLQANPLPRRFARLLESL